MRFVGRNDGEVGKAEIRHRPRDRSDVKRVAWRDENDRDAIALVLSEQRMILKLKIALVAKRSISTLFSESK